jgi:hypothetical protein
MERKVKTTLLWDTETTHVFPLPATRPRPLVRHDGWMVIRPFQVLYWLAVLLISAWEVLR